MVNQTICKCGCGQLSERAMGYCYGHKKNQIPKLCECGCGEPSNIGKRFIHGHQSRGKKKKVQIKENPRIFGEGFCACGCGGLIKPGNRYVVGHSRRGRTATDETKRRMSKALKGLKRTEEQRRAASLVESGNKHYAWTGGDGGEYKKFHPYLHPYDFKKLKKNVFNRDKKKCCVCRHKTEGKARIVTHHVIPVRVGYKSRLCDHESNMVTLCLSCHTKIEPRRIGPGNKDKWKEFLPFAKKYLSRFGYEKMLLNDYI